MAERPRPGRPDRLATAVRALLARRTAAPPARGDSEARLAALERELQEVRTRVNALFFAVISVALGDLIGRAVLS